MENRTIDWALEQYFIYLDTSTSYSENTQRVYRNALRSFREFIITLGVDPKSISLSLLSENWVKSYITAISYQSKSTQLSYLYGILSWLRYLDEMQLIDMNIDRLKELSKSIQPKQKLVAEHDEYAHEISRLIEYAERLKPPLKDDGEKALRMWRDRALILLLAETDLKVSEICDLTIQNLDWKNSHIVLDKDDKKIIFPLSKRVLIAIQEYLDARSTMDIQYSMDVKKHPIFAGHGRSSGKRIKKITTETVRAVFKNHLVAILGEARKDLLTPRSLRHYFERSKLIISFDLMHPTIVNNCKKLFLDEHYDQAIVSAIVALEDEIRNRTTKNPNDYGRSLISKALKVDNPMLKIGSVKSERESAFFLFSGAIGLFKNPRSHRLLNTVDPKQTFECLSFISILFKLLDDAK